MKVTLFPFLSVLLCIMGAMIMLLVVVAQNVREQVDNLMPTRAEETQTLSVQEAEKVNEQVELRAEEADWFAENLAIVKKNAETELADHQTKLALAEKETQKIKDELVRLEQLAKQLDTQTSASPAEVEQLKRFLAQQQRRKEEAELELAELQKEAARKEKSYAIVPYRGPNGTFRRPIYIECCNDKIIIQPEGIELVQGDFQALDRPDNPFDSVLRVIRQYYMETNQIVRGSEPYPLMIIRPSGVEMYENARQATGNWIKEFGYEIVNEDWNIQYPQPNEELHNRIVQQLDRSRSRLSGYLVTQRMAEQAEGYGSNMPQFRVDHRGNTVPAGRQMTQSGEYFQQQLAANRRTAEQQQSGQEFPGDSQQQRVTMPHGTVTDGTNKINRISPTVERVAGQYSEQVPSHPFSPPHEEGRERVSLPEGEGVLKEQPRQMPLQPIQNPPQRPQNWALKEVTRYSSGISRTVKIRCEKDRFVLVSQVGLPVERVIPITDSVFSAADKLVQAVWEFQESWNSAGENMYWKPILQVRVSSGGEQRLQELKVHLRNSGLVIAE